MRGRFLSVIVLMLIVMLLSSCVKRVDTPADELMMYSWSGTSENGTVASLSFDESHGYLNIEGDNAIEIDGLCIAFDTSLTICDEESGVNYTFSYTLYGDRVELTYNGSTLTLQKDDSE